MARGKPRPKGGRPPGRTGKAGVGPGPGYRPGSGGGGTRHTGGSTGSRTMVLVALAIWTPPLAAFLSTVVYLAVH